MPANLENSAVATGLKKVSFHSNPKERQCSNYCTIALISHASKVMLKILQARLQQYVNRELPDVQAGLRKGRGTRDQIANIHWIIKKARVPEKHPLLLFNMLSRLVIAFLPRNKHLLISWLQSPSTVILEPPKIISRVIIYSPDILLFLFGTSLLFHVQF